MTANSSSTAWQFLTELHRSCRFQTREGRKIGAASSSELKRWIENGALVVNGEKVAWDERIDFPVNSVVLFPNHPVTLW